jgi:hypothetical protein
MFSYSAVTAVMVLIQRCCVLDYRVVTACNAIAQSAQEAASDDFLGGMKWDLMSKQIL